MSEHNKVKAEKLGMSYGKARNDLNKKIMFSLLQLTDMDICFRCGEKIECQETMSVEHVEAWLNSDNPVEKFFDLGNISFSHRTCNFAAAEKTVAFSQVRGVTGYKGVRANRPSRKSKGMYTVTRDRKWKPWAATICHNNQTINLGVFDDPRDAARAYDKKAIELKGAKAITNESLGLLADLPV
jgi:hypothetical protein